MKKLILVRHCTTSWNREGRIQGHIDIDLDEGGKKEAREFAEILRSFQIEKVLGSDLKRAKHTATIIGDMLHIPLVFDERLRECRHGVFDGMTVDEVADVYGDEIANVWKRGIYDDYDFSPFGGESRNDVLNRHREVIDEVSTCVEHVVLLVGHGRGLNTVLYEYGQAPTLHRGEYRIIEA